MTQVLAAGWLTLQEAHERSGYAISYLRKLGSRGRVTAYQVGDAWVFLGDSLMAYKAVTRSGPKRKVKV